MKKRWLLVLSFILTMMMLVACGNKDNTDNDNNENGNKNNTEENGNQDANTEMPTADLAGIPDIVAEINGTKIMKDEFEEVYEQQFQRYAMQAQVSGQDINGLDQNELKEQTVDGMINQKLLVQEANKRITSVSETDVNEMIDQIAKQYNMETKEELLAAFADEGIAEDEFMTQVEEQTKIDQLIAEEAGDIEPTEEETKEAYETAKAQQEAVDSEQEIPDFDDVKDNVKEQLKNNKLLDATEAFVEILRKDAKITVHL